MPAIVNLNGVERHIKLNLTKEEEQKLISSINVIKENINHVINK